MLGRLIGILTFGRRTDCLTGPANVIAFADPFHFFTLHFYVSPLTGFSLSVN
jgi:hypothetical protein